MPSIRTVANTALDSGEALAHSAVLAGAGGDFSTARTFDWMFTTAPTGAKAWRSSLIGSGTASVDQGRVSWSGSVRFTGSSTNDSWLGAGARWEPEARVVRGSATFPAQGPAGPNG